MNGKFYIDGIDIATYGARVAHGGLNSLLAYPSTKDVLYNEWAEYDGIDPDLSVLHLAPRNVNITFWFSSEYQDIVDFYRLLTAKREHSIVVSSIGRTFKLVVVAYSSLNYAKSLSSATFTFCEYKPLEGYVYQEPTMSSADESLFIDGVPSGLYGIIPVRGTFDSALVLPGVKESLSRNISTLDGGICDTEAEVRVGSRDFTLNLHLSAKSLEEAFRNYYSFLYDLIAPKDYKLPLSECLRTITLTNARASIDGWYRSSSVTSFYNDEGKVWIDFKVTFTSVGNTRFTRNNSR